MDTDNIVPPAFIIDDDKPRSSPQLLSREYKQKLVERGASGVYGWYTERSQRTRNWNPDTSFDWRSLRTDLSPATIIAIKGFFAVEQFVPDYVVQVIPLVRKSHGRSYFQLGWGSEEKKHSDTWRNAFLFATRAEEGFLEAFNRYDYQLKEKEWGVPWSDPLHLLVYTVFQERATQLNYLNLARIASGKSDKPQHKGDRDEVLALVAQTIATDEAAHYNFFLELLRLHLYYFPGETLQAIQDVLGHFVMPASDLVPNWKEFSESVYRSGIYGPREQARDVVHVVFDKLGIESRKALEEGIKRTRLVPSEDGASMRPTVIWDTFDYGLIEGDVKRLHTKIAKHEKGFGFDEIDPIRFVKNPEWPRD